MAHPDQVYIVRQLQNQNLLAEAEQARLYRAANDASGQGRTWLAQRLQRLGVGRLRGAKDAEISAPA